MFFYSHFIIFLDDGKKLTIRIFEFFQVLSSLLAPIHDHNHNHGWRVSWRWRNAYLDYQYQMFVHIKISYQSMTNLIAALKYQQKGKTMKKKIYIYISKHIDMHRRTTIIKINKKWTTEIHIYKRYFLWINYQRYMTSVIDLHQPHLKRCYYCCCRCYCYCYCYYNNKEKR